MRCVAILLTVMFLSSCQRSLRQPGSVLQAYKQFSVLSQIKSKLRGDTLELDEKRALLDLAEELAPKDPEVKLIRAAKLKEDGHSEEAKAVIESAIQLAPTYSPALSAYGEMLISVGQSEVGRNYCLYALKLNPIDAKARDCAGKKLFKFKR